MSYEFNPETQVVEFPNPYKVENLALIISGLLMVCAGAGSIVNAREHISQSLNGSSLGVIGISIVLLVSGILLLARAFTQLRYYFGRNRPESLAPLVPPDVDADSDMASFYKETLRQNAITFQEPHGPLNGLLYSWLPQLIFSPRVIHYSAQVQFNNFLALTATLLSFLLCWLIYGNETINGWIGIIYGVFTFYLVMRPMLYKIPVGIAQHSRVGIGSLALLIVFALLGPALLGLAAPHLPKLMDVSFNGVVLVTLVYGLTGCGVFGLALKKQLKPMPQAIGSARVTETVTMNTHPNKLIEELDRILMRRWYNNIPNRRYTRKSPDINGKQGKFSAELFEETQPRPHLNQTASGFMHALSTPQFFWLTCLTVLAMFFCASGTLAAIAVIRNIMEAGPTLNNIVFAVGEFAVGLYCYRAAHVLWGRFDFVSELYRVDINGSFESAHLHIGNQFSGSVQSTKNVINIESMTMRVWVSEIDTVIFGRNANRQLIGMRGLQTNADELAALLKNFSEANSMVVAPTSVQDMERAQRIDGISKLAADPAQKISDELLLASAPATHSTGLDKTSIASLDKQLFCNECGTPAPAHASFCSSCGNRLKEMVSA